MFIIFTIGLVLTVCVMRTGAGCCECCERNENESFKAATGLHKTAEKVEKEEPSRFYGWDITNLITPLSPGQFLKHNTATTNVGNNFRPEMGMFIATVKGGYFFSLEAISDFMFELGIFHNEKEVGKVDTNKHSTSVIIELAEKDVVYVKVNMAQENATLSRGNFGGFMISDSCYKCC